MGGQGVLSGARTGGRGSVRGKHIKGNFAEEKRIKGKRRPKRKREPRTRRGRKEHLLKIRLTFKSFCKV